VGKSSRKKKSSFKGRSTPGRRRGSREVETRPDIDEALVIEIDLTPILRELVRRDTEFEAAAVAEFTRLREETLSDVLYDVDSVILSGEEAQPHLERLRHRLETEAKALVDKRSPFEWLWYLRRLGGQFNWNDLPSTDPYCQALAEALCATSTKPETDLPDGRKLNIVFLVDEEALRDLTRLRELVGLLYENHGTTRWAGKDSDIKFTRTNGPRSEPNQSLKDAVRLYDRRQGIGHNILAGAGLAADIQSETGQSELPSVFPMPGQMPGTAKSPRWNGTVDAPPPFGFGRIDLSEVDILMNQQVPVDLRWPVPFPSLMVLSMIVLQPLFSSVAGAGDVYKRFGYCYLTRNALVAWLDWAIELLRVAEPQFIPRAVLPQDGEAAIRELEQSEISLYPPSRGRILHTLGNTLIVDLEAASRAIIRCLERPVNDGEDVNLWSETFELHVQDIINDSPWVPSAGTAPIRGRTLRLNGVNLTDVDALGERDGTLLLVSCKARPYTRAYDRGDYGAIQNVRTLAEDSVAKWKGLLDTVKANKVGDNYDFSGFDQVVGVVVMPFSPFVLEGPCTTEDVPGLRWVSSSQELRTWCEL
jgi:hypothetical protein